jgi:hypothetical protein
MKTILIIVLVICMLGSIAKDLTYLDEDSTHTRQAEDPEERKTLADKNIIVLAFVAFVLFRLFLF